MSASKSLIKSLTRCERSRLIVNKYTNEPITVGCGTCPACLNSQTSSKSFRCNIQQAQSKYCFFLTLTYATEHIPKARVALCEEEDPERFLCDSDFEDNPLGSYYQFTSVPRKHSKINYHDECFALRFYSKPWYIESLKSKIDLSAGGKYPQYSGMLPYLNYADLQYFNKRLRRYLNVKSNLYEQIHTFSIGEYGPVHYRPHYHILLFFDSPRVAENLRHAISKAWSYGNFDLESVTSTATSYVASYVNSIVGMPYIYKSFKRVKPFSRFSVHFAQKPFEEAFEDPVRRESAFLDGLCFNVSGKFTQVRPWRSCLSRFYPRFLGHDCFVDYKDIDIIISFSRVKSYFARKGYIWIDDLSPMEICNLIFKDYTSLETAKVIPPRFLYIIYDAARLSQHTIVTHEKAVDSIYRLYNSYLNFCQNWLKSSDYDFNYYYIALSALDSIDSFYSKFNYKNLINNIQSFSEYITLYPDDDNALRLFYPLSDERFLRNCSDKLSPLISEIRISEHMKMLNNMKHKKLNDANDIFNNDPSISVDSLHSHSLKPAVFPVMGVTGGQCPPNLNLTMKKSIPEHNPADRQPVQLSIDLI